MADDGDPFTKDIAKWLTAPETLAMAEASKGQFAGQFLNERLKGGLLIAVASKTSRSVGKASATMRTEPQKISSALWHHRTDDSFWRTGDVQFKVRDPRSIGHSTNVWCYDIRFDPVVIEAMFPAAPAQEREQPPAPAPLAEPEVKGPPVSDAALAAWYAAYKLAYTGADDTEAKAMESAKGCFPGKSFSRDAVRALRGARSRGRKAKAAK